MVCTKKSTICGMKPETKSAEEEAKRAEQELLTARLSVQEAHRAHTELIQEANMMMQDITDKSELREQDLHRQCVQQVQVKHDQYTQAIAGNNVVKARVAILENEVVMMRLKASAVPISAAAAAATVGAAFPKATRSFTPGTGVGYRIKPGWSPAPGLMPPAAGNAPPQTPTTSRAPPTLQAPTLQPPPLAPPSEVFHSFLSDNAQVAGPLNYNMARDDGSTEESEDEAYQRRRAHTKPMVIENLPNRPTAMVGRIPGKMLRVWSSH